MAADGGKTIENGVFQNFGAADEFLKKSGWHTSVHAVIVLNELA